MQLITVCFLACLVAVVASAHYEHYPSVDSIASDAALYESADVPVHERSERAKRSLLLLKKKLLLGALGLKAAKVGAVGLGVGALALKSKPKSVKHDIHVVYGW